MAHRKAARVFPEPVGASRRTLSPRRIAGQALTCAGVGLSNVCENQRATGGRKPLRTRWGTGRDEDLGARGDMAS